MMATTRDNNQLQNQDRAPLQDKISDRLLKGMGLQTVCCLLVLPLLLTAMGCAPRQPGIELTEDAFESARQGFILLQKSQEQCADTFTADMVFSLSSPLQDFSIDGYFQFSAPTSFQYVVSDPLGQLLFATAGDQASYQILEPRRSLHVRGGILSFAARHEIPEFLVRGPWADWLMARNSFSPDLIQSIRGDDETGGIWLTARISQEPLIFARSLVDLASGAILAQSTLDSSGREILAVHYTGHQQNGVCRQPLQIEIAGLEFGTTILLKLSNLSFSYKSREYQLPVPTHYFKKLMP